MKIGDDIIFKDQHGIILEGSVTGVKHDDNGNESSYTVMIDDDDNFFPITVLADVTPDMVLEINGQKTKVKVYRDYDRAMGVI